MSMTPTVLITGASSGIGEALAREFAGRSWGLVLVARRTEKLEALASTLKAEFGTPCHVIGLDLTKNNAARILFDEVSSRNLTIDCLVNNAGRGDFGAFDSRDWKRDEETIQLNVTVLTSLCHLFSGPMLERGSGNILNIASVAGFIPGPNLAVYHATKAYVLSLSRALHAELSSRGVTVTASCPGPTQSEFFDHPGTEDIKALELVRFMPAKQVAEEAVDATLQGKSVVVHGWLNKTAVESARLVPTRLLAPLVKQFMR